LDRPIAGGKMFVRAGGESVPTSSPREDLTPDAVGGVRDWAALVVGNHDGGAWRCAKKEILDRVAAPSYLSLNRGCINLKNANRIPLRVEKIPLPAGARNSKLFKGNPPA
jgi:hypothetical protein